MLSGLPADKADAKPVLDILKKAFQSVTADTKGKEVVAALVAEVGTIVKAAIEAGINRPCELTTVQERLGLLKNQ